MIREGGKTKSIENEIYIYKKKKVKKMNKRKKKKRKALKHLLR